MNTYNWEEINFPSEKDDWKKFKKNIVIIALNVLNAKKEKIYSAYVSKHNSNYEKQIILLKILNVGGWHYLPITKISASLRGITSKHHGDSYCLNCPNSFATENKRESHKKVSENKNFRNVFIPSDYTKISEFNRYQKPEKAPFTISADLECLMKNIDGCKNNPENLSTTKVGRHIPLDFSMSAISSFKNIENKHHVYRGKDCMNKFCESL